MSRLKSLYLIFSLLILGTSAARAQKSEAADLCRDKSGKICRSDIPKHQFQVLHPCPATVPHNKDACPGFVKDHKIPLACGPHNGGRDVASNLQWQTVAEGHKKDRWEQNCQMAKDSARIHARITRDSVLKRKFPR